MGYVIAFLKDKRTERPGIRTLEAGKVGEATCFRTPAHRPDPTQTQAEQAIMSRLAERLVARGQDVRTNDDMELPAGRR